VLFRSLGRGSKVLDVATGTGRYAFAFAKRGHEVTGVDLSRDMLAIAKRSNRYPNARFLVADATKLPFKGNSFDASCIAFALHLMPSQVRERTLREMARVTKRNGTIIIVDMAMPRNRVVRFALRAMSRTGFGRLDPGFMRMMRSYSDFVKTPLDLGRYGIAVRKETPIMMGMARMMIGRKAA
jgi:demethylmenaquinone methyltransferase/2-methoxy-6-polyprenyl-1,4-benzoquinol methylase